MQTLQLQYWTNKWFYKHPHCLHLLDGALAHLWIKRTEFQRTNRRSWCWVLDKALYYFWNKHLKFFKHSNCSTETKSDFANIHTVYTFWMVRWPIYGSRKLSSKELTAGRGQGALLFNCLSLPIQGYTGDTPYSKMIAILAFFYLLVN